MEGIYENGQESKEYSKQELEKLVVAHGGSRWQALPKDRDCYVFCCRTNCEQCRSFMIYRADSGWASLKSQERNEVG